MWPARTIRKDAIHIIDRCLRSARFEGYCDLSTTKPGTLLKQAILVHSWNDCDDACLGFEEIDLVVNCGDSWAGHGDPEQLVDWIVFSSGSEEYRQD
jgi:hypothetical protein